MALRPRQLTRFSHIVNRPSLLAAGLREKTKQREKERERKIEKRIKRKNPTDRHSNANLTTWQAEKLLMV